MGAGPVWQPKTTKRSIKVVAHNKLRHSLIIEHREILDENKSLVKNIVTCQLFKNYPWLSQGHIGTLGETHEHGYVFFCLMPYNVMHRQAPINRGT